jgi:glyoxylase-like metal-dependent hydrolase (beta-lactamase superfamily II)
MVSGAQKVIRVQCGGSNCFIVDNNGCSVLVDTSIVFFKDHVLKACRNKNIRLIVLTHGHIDHIQNAAAISKALNAPIAMHRADCGLIADNRGEPMLAAGFFGKILLAIVNKGMDESKIDPFEPDVFLAEGDSLIDYGVRASIVELPGHTRGSIGILCGGANLPAGGNDLTNGGTDLIVGDALMNRMRARKPLIYGNRANMIQSVKKIAGYKSAVIHFGHGKSTANKDW